MKETLNKIRIPDKNIKTKNKILNPFLLFLFGVVLGIFSKWLDNLSINDLIWWQHILGILELSNIFSSFGIWYFDLKSVIDLFIFIGTVLVLYVNPKSTIYSLIISIILAFSIRGIVIYLPI